MAELELGPLAAVELAAVARSVADLTDRAVDQVIAPPTATRCWRWRAPGPSPRAAGAAANLRAAVRAATGALARPARDLAEMLAAAGRELSAAELAALPLADRDAAEAAVLDTGLVIRVGGGLRFRHALLAEAVRADLGEQGRRYEQLALAIEAAAPAPDQVAAEVAGHLHRAGRDDLAGPRWQRAARHARTLGAMPEAARFWAEAVRCDLEDAACGWSWPRPSAGSARTPTSSANGRRPSSSSPRNGSRWPGPAAARCSARWCATPGRRSPPTSGLPSYCPRTRRHRCGWTSCSAPPGVSRRPVIRPGRPTLLDQVATLVTEPDDRIVAEMANVELMSLIRLGRFTECEAVAARGGAAARRAGLPVVAFGVWIQTACALSGSGDLTGALRAADAAVAATRGMTVIEFQCLAARAFVLSRLGRHAEALSLAGEQLAMAERMDSAATAARARHDAGLISLAAGRYAEAAQLLEQALAEGAEVSRPAARLARAEALARSGRLDEAAAEVRRAALEPVRGSDQPWALVPRMARVQGLIALARGDRVQARRRLTEAATSWRRHLGHDAGAEFVANFVDLGRPPIVGLVEPDWELRRLTAELAELDEFTEVS